MYKLFAIAVAAVALVATQAASSAPTSFPISGSYIAGVDPGTMDCGSPNGSSPITKCSFAGFVSRYVSGSLVGSSVADFDAFIDCKTGRDHGHGTETFTGSLDGLGSGTLTWRIHFDSGYDCLTGALPGFTARAVIVSGTGVFAGMHGTIDFGLDSYQGVLR